MKKINNSVFSKVILILTILIGSVLSGCGKGASSDKMLTIAATEDPGTADVQKTTDAYTLPLNIYDRLVDAETVAPGESKLVPRLAESWDVSADGLKYTFHPIYLSLMT